MIIVDLREAPQHFATIADRLYRAWWADSGAALTDVEAALMGSLGATDFLFGLISNVEGDFAGTVSAIASDVAERPELGPWIAALWVEPERHGQGIGEQPMAHAVARLRRQGFEKVYLCAQASLRSYYLERGATLIEDCVGEDGLDIFVLR